MCAAARAEIDANEFESMLRRGGREGLPILGGSPFLEETDERKYYGGKMFANCSAVSRGLGKDARRFRHFDGPAGYGERRAAFCDVITVRRK
jgi:hypothetical protein